MASDDTAMTILQLHSSMLQVEDEDEIEDSNDEDDHHRHASHSHYLSRLSMCTTSSSGGSKPPNLYDDDDGVGVGVGGNNITDMGLDMARLSIEGFSEEDADERLSDGKEGGHKGIPIGMSSDSDKETGCYSLPATPPGMRMRRKRSARPCGYGSGNLLAMGLKEYASENEAQRRRTTTTMGRRRRSWFRNSSSSSWTRRRLAGPAMRDGDRDRDRDRDETRLERAWEEKKNQQQHHHKYGNVKAGEEEEVEVEEEEGSECVVITRPKGGSRSLCMDLEEVKACWDLGFELDHERLMTVDIPSPGRVSISGPAASTIDFDTSSGGNSPIANWRISSPGDDPRDVKVRLKVWAQAVALASTSRHVT